MIAGAALPRTSICCDVRGTDRDSRGRPGRPPRLGASAGAWDRGRAGPHRGRRDRDHEPWAASHKTDPRWPRSKPGWGVSGVGLGVPRPTCPTATS